MKIKNSRIDMQRKIVRMSKEGGWGWGIIIM